MTTTEQRMAAIFNEWAERYSKNPEEFGAILDEEGKPVDDYGEACTRYFCLIAEEMDRAGLLPRDAPVWGTGGMPEPQKRPKP